MAGMLTVNKLLPQGRGLAAVLLRRAATLPLDWALRQRSHFDAEDSQGRSLSVALPVGPPLRSGDVLVADDGSLLRVVARPQPLLQLRPCAEHGKPGDLLRAAYQLGRHGLALQVHADQLRLAADPALAALVHGLGLALSEIEAPFEPELEPLAAAASACTDPSHNHHHNHNHGHGHGQDAEPAHAQPPQPARAVIASAAPLPSPAGAPARRSLTIVAAPSPHVHGPGCGHGHDHAH